MPDFVAIDGRRGLPTQLEDCAVCGGVEFYLWVAWPWEYGREPLCGACNLMLDNARRLAGVPTWEHGRPPEPFTNAERRMFFMDVDRNMVIAAEQFGLLRRENPAEAARFQELPPQLEGAARRVLEGRRAVKIARTAAEGDAGALARYAAAERAKKRARANRRRKIERETRKAQRGKKK